MSVFYNYKRNREWNKKQSTSFLIILFAFLYLWSIYGGFYKISERWEFSWIIKKLDVNRGLNSEIFRFVFTKNWKYFTEYQKSVKIVQNDCDMIWSKQEAIPWFKKPARTDLDASFISSWEIEPAGEYSRVILQTQFINKTIKLEGGDYWRCFVTGKTAVPVMKQDLGNGSYEFKFLPMYSGDYSLKLSLEYTLCDGIKQPPVDWFIKGNVQGKEQKQGILFSDIPFINKPLWSGTDVPFKVLPPRISRQDMEHLLDKACMVNQDKCKLLWSGYGSWLNKTSWEPLCLQHELRYPRKRRGVLWIFGDSVSSQFYHNIKKNRICKEIFKNCLYTYNWIYSLENYNISLKKYVRRNSTLEKKLLDDNDFNVSKIIDELKQALYHPYMDENSVILLNYGLHFTEATNFTNFQIMIREVIKVSKTVRCKVVWRTSTSLNRHKYSIPNLHSRRFMTSQRVQLYNAFATNEFCKEGFDVLDVYPLTDSYPGGTGSQLHPLDPVHYEYHVMKPIEKVLERVFGPEQA